MSNKTSDWSAVAFAAVFVFGGIGAYAWNAVKLFSCDFKADYKCEFIHGTGFVVPPLSVVTAWFNPDE